MARALFFLVTIGLAVYAIADIATSDDDDRLGVPRLPWFVVALVPILGPVAWIVVSRAQRARRAGGAAAAPGPARPRPQRRGGPVAPDDDPEFLWRLDQERIRRERERRGAGDDETGGDEPHPSDGDVPDGGARG